MKKQLITLLLIFLNINAYSQIYFENGYYINNAGEKTDCLIRNVDWKNNPIEFEYKKPKSEKVRTLKLNAVREFGIYNVSKYQRILVNIDRSLDKVIFLNSKKAPVFNEELLFLKVLVEGKANLYQYVDGEIKRFFYKTKMIDIEQLIYKKYKTKKNKVGINTTYKFQLWENVKCPDMGIKYMKKINYSKEELVGLFLKYNSCNGN